MKNKLFIFLFFQNILIYAQDSIYTLSAREFYQIVKLYHPLIRNAEAEVQIAKGQKTAAYSGFNPTLQMGDGLKNLSNQLYYDYATAELNIPVWYGANIYTGIQNWAGQHLENAITPGLTNYWGVQIPLAKNLLMDQRRLTLKQAALGNNMAETEKSKMQLEVLREAMHAYWDWARLYENYRQLELMEKNAQSRLDWMKLGWTNGEATILDTMETYTQWLSMKNSRLQAELEFRKVGLALSTFTWNAKIEPVDLPWNAIPKDSLGYTINNNLFRVQRTQLDSSNPYIQLYKWKEKSLLVEKKYKQQLLLPKLDLDARMWNKGQQWNTNVSGIPNNNFSYGFKFEMPLLLSAARGEYKIIQQKLEINQNNFLLKQRLILQKLQADSIEIQQIQQQLDLQKKMVNNFGQLYAAEVERWRNGESTVFLINTRETKLQESTLKLIDLQGKMQKSIVQYLYDAGNLHVNIDPDLWNLFR